MGLNLDYLAQANFSILWKTWREAAISIPQCLAVGSFRASGETRWGGGRVSGQVAPSFISPLFRHQPNLPPPHEVLWNMYEQTSFFPRFRRFRNFHPTKARWLNMQDNSNAALAVETSQNFSFFNLPLASRVWLGSSFCCRAEVKKGESVFRLRVVSVSNLKFPTKPPSSPDPTIVLLQCNVCIRRA